MRYSTLQSCLLYIAASTTITSAIDAIYTCDSPIYCDGPLLRTVQLARLFKDSKTFVDMVCHIRHMQSTCIPVKYALYGYGVHKRRATRKDD